MRDGRIAISQHQVHFGEYHRAIQEQAREEAIRQRIGRIRPVYRETPAAVYLVGEAIPNDVILDEIRSCDDLIMDVAMLETARRLDGIISAELAAKIAPDQWTVDTASMAIEKLGGRMLRGYRSVSWVDLSGVQHQAYIPTHHADDGSEELFGKWGDKLGLNGNIDTEFSQPLDRVAPHGPRPEDKVEIALGTTEERREAEEAFRRQVLDVAMSIGEYRPASHPPLPGRARGYYRMSAESETIGSIPLLLMLRNLMAHLQDDEHEQEIGVDANQLRAEIDAVEDGYRLAG
jgi:hypothetical protein